jgi:hypothetical protein
MAELFAILRGVEKKYGRIREFRISTVCFTYLVSHRETRFNRKRRTMRYSNNTNRTS